MVGARPFHPRLSVRAGAWPVHPDKKLLLPWHPHPSDMGLSSEDCPNISWHCPCTIHTLMHSIVLAYIFHCSCICGLSHILLLCVVTFSLPHLAHILMLLLFTHFAICYFSHICCVDAFVTCHIVNTFLMFGTFDTFSTVHTFHSWACHSVHAFYGVKVLMFIHQSVHAFNGMK